MSQPPPWDPFRQQDRDQYQGQPPHQGQATYPPYGQQPSRSTITPNPPHGTPEEDISRHGRSSGSLSKVLLTAAVCLVAGIAIVAAYIAIKQGDKISSLTNANTSLSQQVARLEAQQGATSQADKTRNSADLAALGVCESDSTETLDNYDPPVTVITGVSISSPTLTDGVASCPYGSFVPVSPQSSGG
jgi:hypothetical protein